MKLVSKFFLILFLTLPGLTFAQEEAMLDINFRESDVVKASHKTFITDNLHGDNNGGAYQILENKGFSGEIVIQHINDKLIIDQSIEMDLGKERIVASFLIDERFHFVTAVINKTVRQIEYTVYYTDDFGASFKENNFLNLPIEVLGEEIGLGKFLNLFIPSFKNNSADKDNSGFISFSRNKNFFVLSFDVFESKTDEHLFYVFDKEMELVYETSFESTEKDKNFNFIDIQVDDLNGTLYYLAKVIEKRTILRGIRNYRFEIAKINQDLTQVSSFEKEGISFGTIRLRIDKLDNKLKAIGTYSEKGDGFDRGIVHIAFNKDDLRSYHITLSPFSDEFLDLKFGNRKKESLKNYFLKGILQRDNGNFVLTSEEIRVVDRSKEHGQIRSPFFYQFKDILVAEVSSDGNLIRANHINKHQEISHLGYVPLASYSGFIKNNDTYLIFNAQKVRKKKGKPNLFIGTSLIPHRIFLLKINDKGEITYKQLDKSETKMLFATGEAMYTLDDNKNVSSLILQGQTLNERQFIGIKF